MSVEVKSLLDELDALQAELEMLPTGCLATHKRKNHEYYGIQKMINGKSSETYVSLKEYPFLKKLYDRRRTVEKRLHEIRVSLKGRKREVTKVRKIQEEQKAAAKSKIMREAMLNTAYKPEELVHYTLRGEFVRSKSEQNVANYFFMHGVDYIYEMSLQLWPGKYVYPDFSIKMHGKWIYIEHLGRLEDPEYAAKWEAKKADYAAAGIVEGVNLICTREYNGHLDMQEIDFLFRQCGIVE